MGITPVNLTRISFNMRAFNLLESMRLNQTSMYRVQNQLATGYRFLRPSQDPLRAASAVNLDGRLDRINEVKSNLDAVNATMREVEDAMQEAINLFREAQTLSIEAVDDSITIDERQALSAVVDSILDQLTTLGNRSYLNTYLFSGHQADAPFAQSHGGLLYSGDGNRMETIVDTDMSVDSFTVPGQEFFAALSSEVYGVVDLDPALTGDTRISDLRGTTGTGVELGRIVVSVNGQEVQIDLSGAATVGDLIDKLNAELPAALHASVGTQGIDLTQRAGPFNVTISDISGGRTARDLGLSGSFSTANRIGPDLDPRLTKLTRVTDLLAGVGLNTAGSLVIRNGSNSATISLAGVETVEDILNRMDLPELGIWVRIADDGCRIEVLNRVSGADLSIEENGGLLATDLGIRSMHADTLLSDLNDGRGVETVTGNDLRITTADGTTIDVDLSGATTVQDVLDELNGAGAGAITAAFVNQGNGVLITDNTVGAGTLTIEALNSSPALQDLGLDVTAAGNTLVGQDVNPLKVDSPFTALLELREGLQNDDRLLMTTAAQRIERVMKQMQQVQGEMASQTKMMAQRTERVEAEITTTRMLLSDVRDADFIDAAVRFQQLQTALQANLSTASQMLNLSLLDFLR